jgi:hypothetical protein
MSVLRRPQLRERGNSVRYSAPWENVAIQNNNDRDKSIKEKKITLPSVYRWVAFLIPPPWTIEKTNPT